MNAVDRTATAAMPSGSKRSRDRRMPSGFRCRWRSLRNPRTWTTTPGGAVRRSGRRYDRGALEPVSRRCGERPERDPAGPSEPRPAVDYLVVSARSVAKIRARMSDRQDDKRGPRRVPLLPLRDIVVFPHMVVPLFVGREKSISALEEAMGKGARRRRSSSPRSARPRPTSRSPEDIFTIGTIGTIIQLLRLPDGTVKVLVEGKRRARDPALHADRRLLHRRGRGDPRRRTSARSSSKR